MIKNDFNEQTDNVVIHAFTFGMNSINIRCLNEEESEGTNIDSLLKATIPDDIHMI